MLLLVIITITHIRTSQCVRAYPGHPVPHADILDDLFSKFLGGSYSNNTLFDFILGEPNQNKDAKITAGDNLDISILDVDSVRKIINFAKKKYENEIPIVENTRRRMRFYKGNYGDDRITFLMKQVIYMTQEKVNSTRMIRAKYSNNPDYQIALLYGAVAAMLGKMESLIAQQRHLTNTTHFIWYLILYEKILACNIDIDDSAEKIFKIHELDETDRGGKTDRGRKTESTHRLNLTLEELRKLLDDPVALKAYEEKHGVEIKEEQDNETTKPTT